MLIITKQCFLSILNVIRKSLRRVFNITIKTLAFLDSLDTISLFVRVSNRPRYLESHFHVYSHLLLSYMYALRKKRRE